MEEQIIKTITAPRVVLKKGMKGNKFGWEVSASSSGDRAEIKKIIQMLKEESLEINKKEGDKKK